jgi:hypothetical protein
MDEEIDLSPFLFQMGKHRVHACGIGDVARQDEGGADGFGEREDALLERLALIGEGDFGALFGAGLGDAPGDRAVVRDAHDEPALALHQAALQSRARAGDGFAHRFPVKLVLAENRAASYTKALFGLTKKPQFSEGWVHFS